jgi:putative transcriptional regulator
MPVRVTLERVLSDQRRMGKDVAREIGLSETQLSLFRSGKVKGIRFETLARLCAALGCRPGDLLDYDFQESDLKAAPDAAGEL